MMSLYPGTETNIDYRTDVSWMMTKESGGLCETDSVA